MELIEPSAGSEEEIRLFCQLLTHSVGNEAESIHHLFDSFQMLKALADEDMYQSKDNRLILFGLLCMQTRFRAVYDQLVKMRGLVTPELCSAESDVLVRSALGKEEQADFCRFAQVFCGIINADNEGGISQMECGMFVQVLDFSCITSR